MKISAQTTIFCLLLLLILGWATQSLSLFDVGRYSFPLILFAGLPFCFRITARALGSLALPIASTLFAIAVALLQGVPGNHILSQSVLAVLAIVFGAGIASINWHKHRHSLERALVFAGVPIVAYGCYQMVARVAHLPGAFLPVTNQQFYVDGGLQRDWDKPEATRASSVFSEPSELGYFCLWLFVIGLTAKNKTLRVVAISLAAAGILTSQSLSAAGGAVVIALAYCLSHGVSRRLVKQIALLAVLFAASLLALKPIAPEAFDRFSERIVQAASFDERADSGRVDHLPACLARIEASPIWGYGISSLSVADTSSGSDVTTINYVMVLMERGIVGAALLFVPWFALAWRAWRLPRNAEGRDFAFLLLTMTLYSFCNFSLTYLLPFWLAFGVAASLVLHTYAPARQRTMAPVARQSFASVAN